MSLNTIERPSKTTPELGQLSDAEVQRRWQGIAAAETLEEAAGEHLSFAWIAELFADKHAERADDLRQQQGALIEAMLDRPIESFHGEFLQLRLIFENRTISNQNYDGSTVSEFCTQNHEKNICDHYFRHTVTRDGREVYEVQKIYNTFGQPEHVMFRWEDGQLSISTKKYDRGRTTEVEVGEDKKDRLIEQFFVETINASAIQLERSADEVQENDQRAKSYLRKLKTDSLKS